MGKPRNTAMLVAAGAGLIGLGSPVWAQTIQGGWEIRVSNVVSPSRPTATVEVWAWFDNVPGVSDLFIAGRFDLVASDGDWSGNFVFPLGRPDPGPIVSGSSIIDVVASQFHAPPLGFFGDPSNPIWVFAAEWSTTDFTPRSVSLDTTNTFTFVVAEWETGAPFQVWPNVIPGSGSITVVPAPSVLLFPAGAFAVARRRRRHAGPHGRGGTPILIRRQRMTFAQRAVWLVGMVVLTAPALAVECAAQPGPCSLEELARLGGEFVSVSSNGQIAIISVANRLLVMDVSDPTDPVEVGRLEGLEGVRSHRMAGSIALVLVDDELRVIDLSNPAKPIQISTVTPIAGEKSWERPAVDGSTVYLVYAFAGPATTVVSIDIADPAHPVVLDSIDGPESTMAFISAGGGVVGCSLSTSGTGNHVWFIDASDPADLRSASIVGSSQYAEDLACNGSIACVFNWFNIDIYDTSNPYQPSIIGGATTMAWFTVEIELAGDILFAAVGYDPVGNGSLHAFDVSNPAQPMSLGTPIGFARSAPSSVAPSGRGAVMLAESALRAVSVDPTLAVVGTYQSEGRVIGADVEGDHLVITSNTGTYFYDVSDPRSPVKTGALVRRGVYGSTVRVQGDLAYLVASPGLRVYDLSLPTGPTLISATPVSCMTHFDVDGTVGIGACSGTPPGIVVIDLSDPTQPVVSPKLPLPAFTYPNDVAIEGDVALVAAETLYVVDVSDPTSPRVVSSLLRRPMQVVLANGIAYVSLLSGSSAIVDLSNPANPIVIGSPFLPRAMDLAVSGDLLYASVHASPTGLWVFDITNPRSPNLIGSFNASYQARVVAADDFGHVALVRGRYGLSLLEACRPCYPDCDGSGSLDVADYLCFQDAFLTGDPYACDCDQSTGAGVCDIIDFLCFQNAFVAGCP